PFSEEKGEVAGKAAKITFTGLSFLLYDGLAQAIQLYAAAASPGKGGAQTLLPAAKAIIVISDGRDNGSATDVEKVISDAGKRRHPQVLHPGADPGLRRVADDRDHHRRDPARRDRRARDLPFHAAEAAADAVLSGLQARADAGVGGLPLLPQVRQGAPDHAE